MLRLLLFQLQAPTQQRLWQEYHSEYRCLTVFNITSNTLKLHCVFEGHAVKERVTQMMQREHNCQSYRVCLLKLHQQYFAQKLIQD